MKKTIRIIFNLAGMLLLLMLMLGALLQTPKGKEVLASALSKIASSNAMEVRIGRIEGWVPLDMRVTSVEIGDSAGIWLTIRDAHARWIFNDLLAGRLRLAELNAVEIELLRFPELSRSESKRRPDAKRLHAVEFVVEGWSIDRLKLGPDLAGIPLEYAVRSGGIMFADGIMSGDLVINGDADGLIDFKASFTDATNHTLLLRAELKQLYKPTFGMDHLSGSLKATINAAGINATVDADIEKDETTGHVSTRLEYASSQLHLRAFRFDGNGYTAAGDVDMTFRNGLVDVGIVVSLTDANAHRYELAGNVDVDTANNTWAVVVPSITLKAWDAVSLSVSGRYSPEQIDLSAELDAFELGRLPHAFASNFAGRVAGTVSVTGSPASPQVNTSLSVDEFTSASDALDELPKLDFRIAATLSEHKLSASMGLTNSIFGYLVAESDMPCQFSLDPFRFSVDRGGLNAELDAFLDLDVFNGLAMLQNQKVAGLLAAELNVERSIPSGFVDLEDGSYEHYSWGILFRDVQARLEATPKGFFVRDARATDGESGALVLAGGFSEGLLDMSIELQNALMIRRPEIEALISGRLAVSGPYFHPNVQGKLVVDRADLLPDNIMSSVPAVLEDYDVKGQGISATQEKPRRTFPIGMDVTLEMPDQVFINASLINSVWGGSLRVRDSDSELWIKGAIEPRRGYVAFIGKQFLLEDGSVEVDSSVHTYPVMNNLTAVYSRSDITARLVLNGSVVDPRYRLESTPPLPEDEILSQVLFKRDANTITPYQAVQIALAARQLSGGLNGPGFLYQFSQAVGVDTLEWREPESQDDGSSIAAGKYITPELYIEVSSTFGAETQTDMTAEYEISRHFSVETSAGPKMRPGIGLNWKNDY